MNFRSEKTRSHAAEFGVNEKTMRAATAHAGNLDLALRAARGAAGRWGTGAEDGGETV